MYQIDISLIKDEISLEVQDLADAYAQPIKHAIISAIGEVQKEEVNFNQLLERCLTLKPGQALYKQENTPLLKEAAHWQRVWLSSKSERKELVLIPYEASLSEIESNKKKGPPKRVFYSVGRDEQFGYYCLDFVLFDPVPDKNYSILFDNRYEGVDLALCKENSYLTSRLLLSCWAGKAYAFIKAKARYLFFKNYLQDRDMALNAYQEYQDLLQYEQYQDYLQIKQPNIKATRF